MSYNKTRTFSWFVFATNKSTSLDSVPALHAHCDKSTMNYQRNNILLMATQTLESAIFAPSSKAIRRFLAFLPQVFLLNAQKTKRCSVGTCNIPTMALTNIVAMAQRCMSAQYNNMDFSPFIAKVFILKPYKKSLNTRTLRS